MKLREIAERLNCRLEGPPEMDITGVAGMEHAVAGQLTFLANRRYFSLLRTTRASALFIEEGISLNREPKLPPLSALRTPNPYLCFARAIEFFYQPPYYVHCTVSSLSRRSTLNRFFSSRPPRN